MSTSRSFVASDTAVAVLCVILFAVLLACLRNPVSLDDGLRHVQMAKRMTEQGIVVPGGWSTFLYEGALSRTDVDPWFLSDVLLMPVAHLPVKLALDIFALCELSLITLAAFLLLRRTALGSLERAAFLTLFLFGEVGFLGRILIARPFSLITGSCLLLLWAVQSRRWWMVGACVALSVLLSQLCVFVLLLACIAIAIACFFDREAVRPLFVAVACGSCIGLSLHPHALAYLEYLGTVFLKIPFLKSVGLSVEMRTGLEDDSFINLLIVCALCVLLGVWLWMKRGMRLTQFARSAALIVACAALVFGACYLIWARAIDVLWPLSVLLLAQLWSMATSHERSRAYAYLRALWNTCGAILRIPVLCLLAFQLLTVPRVLLQHDGDHALRPYHPLTIIPAHSTVLNFDWDQFFPYITVRPDLRYATGIDPVFTALTDPEVSRAISHLRDDSATMTDAEISSTVETIIARYPSDALLLSHYSFNPVIRALDGGNTWKMIADSREVSVFVRR